MAEGILDFFSKDHDRLDQHFARFQELKGTDFARAKDEFRSFFVGLKRHIVWEEEILFPLFEAKTGVKHAGPTAVMRDEHRLIKEQLEQIHEKVKKSNPESNAEEQKLLEVLKPHNDKEEGILYPMIDRVATGDEIDDVFSRIEKITEADVGTCCS